MWQIAHIYIMCVFLLGVSTAKAQYNVIHSDDIASVQVTPGGNWLSMPVIKLGDRTPIKVSFDYLGHDYRRLSYRVEHCDADWKTSQSLFVSDFLDGIAEGNTIDDYEQSSGTNTLYTHYIISLPNEALRLKLSGNYRMKIFDDNTSEQLLTVCFMVVEQKTTISLDMTTNTDIDTNEKHQQVRMKLAYGGLGVSNPARQIQTVVMQNGRWDNCVVNASPDIIADNTLEWRHSRELIFDSGNEYRKFEATDIDHATLGVESMVWDKERGEYNAILWTDEPRLNYVYDEDANGTFYIRNSDDVDNETTSEYMTVHFRLNAPRQNGDVYINGRWTNGDFSEVYRMEFDEKEHLYRKSIRLKQGYYSYQYLLVTKDGKSSFISTEGSFCQTENQYQVLVYYRGNTDRTDRLVGFAELRR